MVMLNRIQQSVKPTEFSSGGFPASCLATWLAFLLRDCQMEQIPLTQGKYALIDDEDFELVSKHKWCALHRPNNRYYAVTAIKKDNKWTTLRMHRLIMNAQKEQQIDHRNGNGLDNLRSNLRICTMQENFRNAKLRINCSSKYKGVSRYKPMNKWRVAITLNYKYIHLGYFDSEVEAARCYDTKAKELFGEFARTNF